MAVAANVIKMWKGAVQPASAGSTGNVIFLWKGAVQPAAPSLIADPDGRRVRLNLDLGANLLRGLTRNLHN